MLQQTQVATVIPYFQRFLAAFPTLIQLADAPESEVLRLWEGLGYYRRARQLHRAAQLIRDEHGGVFPTTWDEVRALPGIGRYTAGAILSISTDARLPILEANTVRLFSRLLAFAGDPTSRTGQELLWKFAEEILPRQEVGEFNQALMELGSLVCTPREPRCALCPVMARCPTFASGQQSVIPAPKKKKQYESVEDACVVVWRGAKVLLRCCLPGERWAGLWDFPRFTLTTGQPATPSPDTLREEVRRLCGVEIVPGDLCATLKHGVTRFRITLRCYHAQWRRGRLEAANHQWVLPGELDALPLTKTARQLGRLLAT